MPRNTVLVSGCPGAGKSTLALPLARALDLPLVAKDDIKETIFDALQGPPGDLAFSRRVGAAAMETLWKLASRCPEVMLEANFRPRSAYERERIVGLNSNIIEIYCSCPPQLALERYDSRATASARHAAHAVANLSAKDLAEFDIPIGLGHVLAVDTSRPVDIEALAGTIRSKLVARS